jgi:hypothetical protein
VSKLVDWFKWKLTGHLHISQDKPLGFGWYSSNLNQSNDKYLFEAESCELAIQRELEQTGQIFRVLAVFYYIILWSNPWTIWTGNPAQPSAFNILILFESFWHFSNRFEVFDIILTLQQCGQAHEAPWVAHDRNSCGQAIQMTWTSSSASAADQWHTAAAWWININIRYIYIHTYIRIYIYNYIIYINQIRGTGSYWLTGTIGNHLHRGLHKFAQAWTGNVLPLQETVDKHDDVGVWCLIAQTVAHTQVRINICPSCRFCHLQTEVTCACWGIGVDCYQASQTWNPIASPTYQNPKHFVW